MNVPSILGMTSWARPSVSRSDHARLVPNMAAPANAPGRSGTYSETNGTFASSIDSALTHLTSAVTYDLGCAASAGSAGLPVLAYLHGYSQDMGFIAQSVLRNAADKGFVAMAINMRGRGGDSGTPDDSCRELHDIWDAIGEAKTRLGVVVDRARVFFMGFSGGGGNALALHTKYPGKAIAIVSLFFGGDYGFSAVPGHSYWASGDNPAGVVARIGPRTDLQPYRARLANSNIAQAVTQTSTKLYLAWDSADLIGIPLRDTKHALRDAGAPRSRWWASESNPNDTDRWEHGYINSVPDLQLLANVLHNLRASPAAAALTTTGTYKVTGHLVHAAGFEVWTADTGIANPKTHATGGQRHVVDVAFDVPARRYTVTRQSGNCAVQVRMGNSSVTRDVSSDGYLIEVPA